MKTGHWRTTAFGLVMLITTPLCYSLTPQQIFEAVRDSVLVVRTFDSSGNRVASGSAVFLPSGKFATNCHVIEGAARIEIGRNNLYAPAKAAEERRQKDVCLLSAPNTVGAKPVSVGSTKFLTIGSPVFAVGAPRGLELSMSDGIVSQLRGEFPKMIQTTAAVSSGSSGGGLFDSNGYLIGMTTLTIENGQNLNFAIPVEWITDPKDATTVSGFTPSHYHTAWYEHITEGRHQEALIVAQEWVKKEPNNENAILSLGNSYSFTNNHSKELELLSQATKRYPSNSSFWGNLGRAYQRINKPKQAIQAYQKVLAIVPNHHFVWNELGLAYLQANQPQNAVQPLQEAIKLGGDSQILDQYWFNLGRAYDGTKRYLEAVQAFNAATKVNSGDWTYWWWLANSRGSLYQHNEAIKAL